MNGSMAILVVITIIISRVEEMYRCRHQEKRGKQSRSMIYRLSELRTVLDLRSPRLEL